MSTYVNLQSLVLYGCKRLAAYIPCDLAYPESLDLELCRPHQNSVYNSACVTVDTKSLRQEGRFRLFTTYLSLSKKFSKLKDSLNYVSAGRKGLAH